MKSSLAFVFLLSFAASAKAEPLFRVSVEQIFTNGELGGDLMGDGDNWMVAPNKKAYNIVCAPLGGFARLEEVRVTRGQAQGPVAVVKSFTMNSFPCMALRERLSRGDYRRKKTIAIERGELQVDIQTGPDPEQIDFDRSSVRTSLPVDRTVAYNEYFLAFKSGKLPLKTESYYIECRNRYMILYAQTISMRPSPDGSNTLTDLIGDPKLIDVGSVDDCAARQQRLASTSRPRSLDVLHTGVTEIRDTR